MKILIADRDPLGSQLLSESLRGMPVEIVSSLMSEAVSSAKRVKPDVVVVSAECKSGPRCGMEIARALRNLRVVILLEQEDRAQITAAFRNGATGVFCRDRPLAELRDCIEKVNAGMLYAKGGCAKVVMDLLRRLPSTDGVEVDLSRREEEVAEQAAQGFTNREIGVNLGLSEHTVKNYLFRVFEKLEVNSRIELLFCLDERRLKAIDFSDFPFSGRPS